MKLCVFCVALLAACAQVAIAQNARYERTLPQSKAAVENALKQMQTSGHLPVLDGFATAADRPLDRFQRGYYQCSVQVSAVPNGGARVQISAKITAWYADPAGLESGYQVLPSNGRLETDLLDQLQEKLGSTGSSTTGVSRATPSQGKKSSAQNPTISAPEPNEKVRILGSQTASPSSPFKVGSPATTDVATQRAIADKHVEELTKEAKGLQEILRNQAHPSNLVAIKKDGTPVMSSPTEGAKVLFLAAAEDEFEILDMNASWVHVRISGLSRGWIRRASLEMPTKPDAEAEPQDTPAANGADAANLPKFQVANEEIASFPGSWEPLRGKTVKILTVQRSGEKNTSPQAKLDFAKSLFDKESTELKPDTTTAAGVVLIFDSEDGGMTAATLATLQQWKAGYLSNAAFWRRCFFDPPEAFNPPAGQ